MLFGGGCPDKCSPKERAGKPVLMYSVQRLTWLQLDLDTNGTIAETPDKDMPPCWAFQLSDEVLTAAISRLSFDV